ncbi:hypothetical protein NDU88_000137 [Pleurodeles waltl]|uniref:Uncharacterized protein n=1 Tax=Pleurodeles waltl TaxID=8319 RepID=A0AAV7L9B4_PLEWA|nr:hypothetical protein NDU88_000137 [Pleurodeles waltl]
MCNGARNYSKNVGILLENNNALIRWNLRRHGPLTIVVGMRTRQQEQKARELHAPIAGSREVDQMRQRRGTEEASDWQTGSDSAMKYGWDNIALVSEAPWSDEPMKCEGFTDCRTRQ